MVRGTSIVFVLTQRKDWHPATGGADAIVQTGFRGLFTTVPRLATS